MVNEILISEMIKNVPMGIQIFKDIKSLFNELRSDLEKQTANNRWAVYINPIHSFKISWPPQRWAIQEIGNIAPNIYTPIQIFFKMTQSIRIPSLQNVGESQEIFPNVNITIDLNGGIEMGLYVKSVIEMTSEIYGSIGAEFIEEKTARKVEDNKAQIAFHVKYANAHIWQLQNIQRYNNKMYTLTGTIVDSISNADIASQDLVNIMKSFSIVQ